MSDLSDLYQEVILDHYKRPRNYGSIPDADRRVDGRNPLCGDHLTIFVKMDGETVGDVRFEGERLCDLEGVGVDDDGGRERKTRAAAQELFERFHAMVTGHGVTGDDMGKLQAFAGVSDYPARVKCASLAWHTLKAALDGASDPVSTE